MNAGRWVDVLRHELEVDDVQDLLRFLRRAHQQVGRLDVVVHIAFAVNILYTLKLSMLLLCILPSGLQAAEQS